MSSRVLIFIAKAANTGYGGDDTFVLQLVKDWPRADDRLVVAVNHGHPSHPLYRERMAGRAELLVMDEMLTSEDRLNARGADLLRDIGRPFGWFASVGRMFVLLRQLRPRAVILSDGGYPVTNLTWRMLCAAWIARIGPRILVVHNYPGRGTNALRRLAHRFFRSFPPLLATHLVVGSASLSDALQRYARLSRPPARIPYGIDPGAPAPGDVAAKRRRLGAPQGRLIGAIANVEERKGLRHLILAMKEIVRGAPDVAAIIPGLPLDAALDAQLRQLIVSEGLQEHVIMPGFVPDVQSYLECFELLVIPSLIENFPIVALDAMRYGKPIVASTSGGLPEAIADGETGILVPPADPHAIAQAVLRLLASTEERQRMGARGRERLVSQFSARGMAERYAALTVPADA